MNTQPESSTNQEDVCTKCGSPLTDVIETPTGKRLRRCTKGEWNSKARKIEGCDYVKWLPFEKQQLDEKCPKCGSPLVLDMTRFGKKMKKCSTGGWDAKAKKPTGCTYVEWINASEDTGEEYLPPEPEEE